MKKKSLLQIVATSLLIIAISAIAIRCQKNSTVPGESKGVKAEIASPELMAKMKLQQDKQMQEGIVVFEKKFSPGELEQTGRRHIGQSKGMSVGCDATDSLGITSFTITYKNGNCSTTGNYIATIEYYIHVSATSILTNYTPLTTILDAYNGSTALGSVYPTSTFLYRGGQYWYFTATVDVTPYYCSMTKFFYTAYTRLQCYDYSITYYDPIGIYNGVNVDGANQCKTLAPVFFTPKPSGSGTLYIGGWISCTPSSYNPCFALPNAIEVSYKRSSDVTWSTYELNPYLNNGYTLSGLAADVYDVKWRNHKVTATACYGPYSTVTQYNLQ